MAMEFFIVCAPQNHPVIPGAGGFRKARELENIDAIEEQVNGHFRLNNLTCLSRSSAMWTVLTCAEDLSIRPFAESLKIDPAEGQMTKEQRLLLREKRNSKGAQEIAHLVAAIRRDLFETAAKKTDLSATEFGHYS